MELSQQGGSVSPQIHTKPPYHSRSPQGPTDSICYSCCLAPPNTSETVFRRRNNIQVDIIHRYNADEARNLKQYGELPEHARINETAVDLAMEGDGAEDDIGIDFDDI